MTGEVLTFKKRRAKRVAASSQPPAASVPLEELVRSDLATWSARLNAQNVVLAVLIKLVAERGDFPLGRLRDLHALASGLLRNSTPALDAEALEMAAQHLDNIFSQFSERAETK